MSTSGTYQESPDANLAAPEADAETLLTSWRVRLLGGLIVTSICALVPAFSIHTWQALQGVAGAEPGIWIALSSIVALTGLGLWSGPYRLRASALLGIGLTVVAVQLFTEGFSPAQCMVVCILGTITALLFSTRVVSWVLGTIMSWIGLSAWLYSAHILPPMQNDMFDTTQPLNWARIALYTLFASATSAVAAGYLISKLRLTLQARMQLVTQLSAEIASRERALRELERAQAQLVQSQKLEAVGQLAAGIAHDFNNTLSIVSLEAGLLTRTQQPEIVTRSAEALLGAAERGKQLTQQLLLFSRPPSLGPSSLELASAFEECVGALRRLLPSEITFEVDIAPGQLVVNLQPSELQQIVLNLGINARDSMAGGGSLRLALARHELGAESAGAFGVEAGGYALLSCSDTGCGMSDLTLARVFEPFFSTKGTGHGTGLGLTNVWNIARRSGGHVQVTSALGAGTTLLVYLPLSAAVLETPELKLAQHAPWRGRETVLVVEDDLRIRALLVTTLSDAGYRVLDAPNVDAALALEASHGGPIDMVCTDVVMPGRQARDLLMELRVRRPRAGILVCSGYSEDEQIARGIRSGEWKLLAKPFTRWELLAAVRSTLERPAPRTRERTSDEPQIQS